MKTGAWNYTPCYTYPAKRCVSQWKELGFSLMLSSISSDSEKDNDYIVKTLIECEKENIKLIVVNSRLFYSSFVELGEELYEEKVSKLAEIYKKYSSFAGFFVCDEPHKADFPILKKTCSVVSKYTSPFINFLAIHAVIGCSGWDDTNEEEYFSLIEDLIKKHGLRCVSYDFYNQCDFHFDARGKERYFYNLNKFGELARRNNVPLFVSNLCVGHWCFREPTLDDIRWQLSTSFALGAEANFWFYLYEREFESSYRNAPIDLFGKKNDGYYFLKREDCYSSLISKQLQGYQFEKAIFINGIDYKNDEFGMKIKSKNKGNLILSVFKNEGKAILTLVNNEQRDIDMAEVEYKGISTTYYFAPGQIYVLKE